MMLSPKWIDLLTNPDYSTDIVTGWVDTDTFAVRVCALNGNRAHYLPLAGPVYPADG